MLQHSRYKIPDTLFQGLTVEDRSNDAAVEFEKFIKAGYEQARKRGLAPNEALAVLLAWAAKESVRLEGR